MGQTGHDEAAGGQFRGRVIDAEPVARGGVGDDDQREASGHRGRLQAPAEFPGRVFQRPWCLFRRVPDIDGKTQAAILVGKAQRTEARTGEKGQSSCLRRGAEQEGQDGQKKEKICMVMWHCSDSAEWVCGLLCHKQS